MNIVITAIIGIAICTVSLSVYAIQRSVRTPANEEVKQLKRIDEKMKKDEAVYRSLKLKDIISHNPKKV